MNFAETKIQKILQLFIFTHKRKKWKSTFSFLFNYYSKKYLHNLHLNFMEVGKYLFSQEKLEIHFEPPGLKNWHFAKLENIIRIELLQFLNTVLSGLKKSCVRNILSTKG